MPVLVTPAIQDILIDEKLLDSCLGFVTLCLNAATGEPLEMVKGKDSRCLDDFFNRLDEKERQMNACTGQLFRRAAFLALFAAAFLCSDQR